MPARPWLALAVALVIPAALTASASGGEPTKTALGPGKQLVPPRAAIKIGPAKPKMTLTAAERAQVKSAVAASEREFAKTKNPLELKRGSKAFSGNQWRAFMTGSQQVLALASHQSWGKVRKMSKAGTRKLAPRYTLEGGAVLAATEFNCKVTVELDLSIRNGGGAVEASSPAPLLVSDSWADMSTYTQPIQRLPASTGFMQKFGPFSWQLEKSSSGACLWNDMGGDLRFQDVNAPNEYYFTITGDTLTIGVQQTGGGGGDGPTIIPGGGLPWGDECIFGDVCPDGSCPSATWGCSAPY